MTTTLANAIIDLDERAAVSPVLKGETKEPAVTASVAMWRYS